MKFSLSLLSICILSFVLIYSCSTEEDNNSIPAAPDSLTPLEINTTDVINDPEVFNYDVNKGYSEQIVDFYPNAFFASDLSLNVINGINLALKTAADAFGKYGPVEYWVFGADKQAALDLVNKFCERRVALNQWSLTDCLNRETDESLDYSMIAYQKIGEEVISTNQPRGGAGHNGGFQWGIHKLSSSYPFSFDNLFEGIPPQDDFKTVLHEYFHVFQLSSVFNLEDEVRRNRVAPDEAIWIQEEERNIWLITLCLN
jgi:hypothetical protein